jgi:hypothetical protein
MGVLLTTLSGGTVSAQNAEFILENNTGFAVYSVYFWPSASESDYRGPDRLGDRIIPSGASHTFTPRDGECTYDIRVTLEGGSLVEQWNNVDLCHLSTVTLHYNYTTQDLWASRE